MKPGNRIFSFLIIFFILNNSSSRTEDKIISTPLINLEKIKPSFEESNEEFENLISNAFKYSQESNPFVVLIFESDRIVVSVEDKGIGIPEADVEKLFQPFYRAENVGPAPGTGLGLAIAKEYVELNGGSIHLQSVENKGTTVTVELPLQLIDHYEHKPISTEVHLEN